MRSDRDNPFAGYGKIVFGDSFIGRKNAISQIESRVLKPRSGGNLAIIGEPRIGKSSLAYHAIMFRKDELASEKSLLPIWISVGAFNAPEPFFESLVQQSVDSMLKYGWFTGPMAEAAKRLREATSWSEKFGSVQRFFRAVRAADRRILFVLDEFDQARILFKGSKHGFQALRELSYQPETRVTYVTTSRRAIRDIEKATQDISTLDGIFQKLYLGMFGEEDMTEYFCKLESVTAPLSLGERERMQYYCGGHPWSLGMMGYEIVEAFEAQGLVKVEDIGYGAGIQFAAFYDHIVDLMNEDGSLDKLLQILFGPVVDVRRADVERFLNYGIIQPSSGGVYKAFSNHFEAYLRIINRGADLWPIWTKAEKGLRSLISAILKKQYGEGWQEQLPKRHQKLQQAFQDMRDAQEREKANFGNQASPLLLDYAYPGDLFAIMFAEWPLFSPILGNNRNYWNERAVCLAKIRTPLMHIRQETVPEYQRKIAEGYCEEIQAIVEAFRRTA